jgi:hypothetical protein
MRTINITTHRLMSPGFGSHINAYVVNAQFAHRSLTDDFQSMQNPSKRARTTFQSMYTPISDLKDYSIKRGELLWEKLGSGNNPLLNDGQQASVRSVVNGATFTSPNTFESMIRVHGFSREDVIFDGKSIHHRPSNDPVIVVAGVQTVFNTGEQTIRPGEALEWYLVDGKKHKHQINDGITQFVSPTRFSLGLRPIEISCNVSKIMKEDEGFKQCWTTFVESIKSNSAFNLQVDDEAFDAVLHAIQMPIVAAYENHAAVATTGAGKGHRMDFMISAPFSLLKLEKPRVSNVTVTTPPPPPPSKKTIKLNRSIINTKVQFKSDILSTRMSRKSLGLQDTYDAVLKVIPVQKLAIVLSDELVADLKFLYSEYALIHGSNLENRDFALLKLYLMFQLVKSNVDEYNLDLEKLKKDIGLQAGIDPFANPPAYKGGFQTPLDVVVAYIKKYSSEFSTFILSGVTAQQIDDGEVEFTWDDKQ